jgi:hypothetical protein
LSRVGKLNGLAVALAVMDDVFGIGGLGLGTGSIDDADVVDEGSEDLSR